LVNPKMETLGHTDPLGVTAENVAEEYRVGREDQDAFAVRSQERAAAAMRAGLLAEEVAPVTLPQRGGPDEVIEMDEHPRPGTTMQTLAKLPPVFRQGGTVTAGNSSGINDGAAALLLASTNAVERFGLSPLARYAGSATAGVPPRIMGIGPIPATEKLMARTGRQIGEIDIIELGEAFA
ncbi:MAG: 3-oxoadipyl-CoA thiolase, partial [bacterium]|nr:3-oxoadipyl-CoA thiolase [bacterium]